jgi:hypothetical protein
LENPQFQQLLESSGETDESCFVTDSLMQGRSFSDCLKNTDEQQAMVNPPSPFIVGH